MSGTIVGAVSWLSPSDCDFFRGMPAGPPPNRGRPFDVAFYDGGHSVIDQRDAVVACARLSAPVSSWSSTTRTSPRSPRPG